MKLSPATEAAILATPGVTVRAARMEPAPDTNIRATEKQFQADVIRMAKRHSWRVFHTYSSKRCEPGYPDLTFVGPRIFFAELKVEPNKATPEQLEWLEAIRAAHGEAYLWFPADWPEIERILREGGQ